MLKIVELGRIDRADLKQFLVGNDDLEGFPQHNNGRDICMIAQPHFLNRSNPVCKDPLGVYGTDQSAFVCDLSLAQRLPAFPLLCSGQVSAPGPRRTF